MHIGPFNKQRIGIMGGSIAGLATAILLRKQGLDVTVLERATQSLETRGAGIVLPEPLIQQCIAIGLFDDDLARLPATSRSFIEQNQRVLWQHPIAVMGLNWSDIYSQCRKRVPATVYHAGEKGQHIRSHAQGYDVQTESGATFSFDYLIGADGIDSCVRKFLCPLATPHYAGYVAWRGTVPLSQVLAPERFQNQIPYFVYPQGHILLYTIPANDYDLHGNVLLNWVMYDTCQSWQLSDLLRDANGVDHPYSLPPGSLGKMHLEYLKGYAQKVLPADIADIIRQTEAPFLQPIFDLEAPTFINDHLYLIGDAAAVLRPHTASGVVKALTDSISFANAFADHDLTSWQTKQHLQMAEQILLSKHMGQSLVQQTPEWPSMNAELMGKWWSDIMAGKQWVYTPVVCNA